MIALARRQVGAADVRPRTRLVAGGVPRRSRSLRRGGWTPWTGEGGTGRPRLDPQSSICEECKEAPLGELSCQHRAGALHQTVARQGSALGRQTSRDLRRGGVRLARGWSRPSEGVQSRRSTDASAVLPFPALRTTAVWALGPCATPSSGRPIPVNTETPRATVRSARGRPRPSFSFNVPSHPAAEGRRFPSIVPGTPSSHEGLLAVSRVPTLRREVESRVRGAGTDCDDVPTSLRAPEGDALGMGTAIAARPGSAPRVFGRGGAVLRAAGRAPYGGVLVCGDDGGAAPLGGVGGGVANGGVDSGVFRVGRAVCFPHVRW